MAEIISYGGQFAFNFFIYAVVNEDSLDGVFSMHGAKKNACKVFVGKPEGKRSLRRTRHRWGNI